MITIDNKIDAAVVIRQRFFNAGFFGAPFWCPFFGFVSVSIFIASAT